jgi:spoIIIJ-associated protein
MSDKQEFYAATVEQALDKASNALGITRNSLDFEVLDEGSTGFLGIGARDARILVRSSRVQKKASVSSPDEHLQLQSHKEEQQASPAQKPEGTEQLTEEDSAAPAIDTSYDLIIAVDEFMTALIDAMGLDATVEAQDVGDAILVNVATKETGLFIGQKGETIDAIQYLLNVAIYKDRPFLKRIVVDSEGYRRRRVEAIQGMAHRTARRAVREKRSLSLPPMSAAERRVVHLFLKENPNVTTSSDGKEEDRRVIISPV